MGYENLYYSPKDEKFARDAESYIAKGYDLIDKSKMVAGFHYVYENSALNYS